MSKQEIEITFWTLTVSSILNIVTICCNIYWNSVEKKERKKLENFINARDTILKYYLPIKYKLFQIKLLQEKIKEEAETFDVFSLYTENTSMRSLREAVISEYKKYIDIYNKLEMKYADRMIDKKLDEIYMHIYFILSTDEQRTLDKYKKRYSMPCLSDLIEKIDTYSIKNNIF